MLCGVIICGGKKFLVVNYDDTPTKLFLSMTGIHRTVLCMNNFRFIWASTVLCKTNVNEICRNKRNNANFGNQIANFRFRRKSGEISALLLF